MLRRSKKKLGVFFLIFFLVSPLYAADDTGSALMAFYQNYISVADGDRCPMTPTCSAYAAECFKKHGPVTGWIMALDRLVRCGRDETSLCNRVKTKTGSAFYDPVSANDFWWAGEKESVVP